jgi:acetolactate synthase-1/2/3 large subunit
MPMLMLTGQKPIKNPRQARFQMVDIVGTLRPLTKMTRQIVAAASIPALVRDAFRVAMEERPGPVHLELPEDIAAEAADATLVPAHPIDWPIAAPHTVERVAGMIRAARRPLIMIGAAGNRPRLVDPLSEFVRRAGIPFFNTQMGKGAVTGSSDLYMGTAALSERDYVHDAIDQADLIVAIGHDTVEKPPFLMDEPGGARRLVHVGFLPANVEQVFYPDAELIGDIGANVLALAAHLEGHKVADRAFVELRPKILAHINERAESNQFPILPQRLVHDVRAVVPEEGIVCLDNGMYKIWFARNYRTRVANTLLLDNALATMGAGLPSAMMAKLLNPYLPVLAVCGDGGFMMNSQELETAVRLKLSLVVLIVVDGAYGMIRWKQAVDRFPDYGMTFGNPDFVKYAAAYGAHGHHVASAEALVPTLREAFAAGGTHLVAVPIDYRENSRVLVEELGRRDRKASGAP